MPVPNPTTTMLDTANQQQINMKTTSLTENLILLLENTIHGSSIYTMAEKINFMKLVQTQYHNLIFEQELFNLLLKNKYAINNNIQSENINENITYSNIEYPFPLIICSGEAFRSSILVNNVGMVLIKFILYLRMLNKNVARPDCPNCLLATNMAVLPFGRICIDIDYKNSIFDLENDNCDGNEDYEKFIEDCFSIVCQFTTTGNILMTQNCFTPNTRSLHLITEQQFDAATREIIFFKISERIKMLNPYITIDQVQTWMLPFGRGHVPVRKYNRKTNEFLNLSFPYTEIDFELSMPFDLNLGMDNLHTLLNYVVIDNTDDDVADFMDSSNNLDILNEYLNDEIVHSYHLQGIRNIKNNIQLFVKIVSFKYDFSFASRNNFRYEYNYLPQVFGNKYNNFFIVMSNKKLLFENNWQIPKPKIKQRPVEFYEIYRFLDHRFLNGIENMEDLFRLMPKHLVQKNVNIGNVDEIVLDNKKVSFNSLHDGREINQVYSGNMIFNFSFYDVSNGDIDIDDYIQPHNQEHPWPYMIENCNELSSIASVNTKYIYEFYRKTITKNIYPYEKNPKIMLYFQNIQSIVNKEPGDFVNIIKNTCDNITINGDIHRIQKYIFPMYEFFCRTHYIDACINMTEYDQLSLSSLDIISLNITEEALEKYRKKYIEFSPSKNAYRKFPFPNTPLEEAWEFLSPQNKILIHIIYLLIIEHNYTSIFFYMHKIIRTNDTAYLICSILLNILEDSYMNGDDEKVISYASREFLNFIYMTFIDAGTNMQCGFEDGNVCFNMVNLQSLITDMQTMFLGSPIWFFLSNFQYMDENMDYSTRFDLFLQIFQQDAQIETQENRIDGNTSGVGGSSGNSTNAKQPKIAKSSIFVPDKYFKNYNINERFHSDLLDIFFKNIISLCKTENGVYIYDGSRFCSPSLSIKYNPQIIKDPVKYSPLYRHQFGIYNTWTMQYERNISSLYTQINISNDDFAKYPELFNAYDDDIYKILVNRFLKSITFTQILKNQKNLALFLAPIYDPNAEITTNPEVLNYNIDSIQINIHDLSSSDFTLPDEMFHGVLQNRNKLYEMLKWLYAIICHYSESFSCIITNPGSFIPKCMIQTNSGTTSTSEAGGNDSSYSLFQQHMTDNRYTLESDVNKGENLMQRIHKILNSKKAEQQQNITDELQKLSQQELTSLIILFDNITKCDEKNECEETPCTNVPLSPSPDSSFSMASSSSLTSVSSLSSQNSESRNNERDNNNNNGLSEDINKFNLSTRGGNGNVETNALMFYNNDEYMENSKNKLLLNLFNRKLSNEITQMPPEVFKKIIDENFSTHIIKFVLLTLSWLIRTIHVHIFSETIFFRELQQHRQLLYNEMCDLVFKFNGHFIYNNSIIDIVDIFGCYCKNTKLVVDPIFEMSFSVDDDIYLGFDEDLENRVSPEIIKDIEAGCVSGIYQGQFIENTNVDLNRLWGRVTIPRNKHRISPLFSLHTATGKSEYLTERCRKHFNNKYMNNFLDATSLKTNDRGIDMARELNSNLIVFVEEFSNLTDKFKQICGHSSITYKPLWADTKSSFQNNATVILATNQDPKCTEAAVIARLHSYPRRIQYSNVNKYLKFQRASICSAATILNINNIFAVQLIMDKMPRVVAENYKGNFMMTWILKRFFLYNIIDPVTVQTSETLQTHIDNFYSMINAPQLVLDRLEVNKGEMSTFQFRKLVNRICEENRNLFNSKIDTYNVYTEVCDRLKSMINTDTQTIRVSERPEKLN